MYPDFWEFVNSTSAARVNGYLAGHGKQADVEKEFQQLGLSENMRKRVLSQIEH